MKKYIVALFALAVVAVSCREFEPVFTLKYPDTPLEEPVTDAIALARFGADDFTSIKDLKALYTKHGEPIEILDPIVIRGEVTSSDESGNVYRELFVQDATGAIDFKIGRSSSYDDYKIGQILYINCNGLVLGEYGFKDRDYSGSGQLQLGLKRNMAMNLEKGEFEAADDYETSYIDLEPVLRAKVLKGAILPEEDRMKPKSDITGAQILSYGYDEVVVQKKKPQQFQLSTNIQEPLVGMLVELKGLQYASNVFTLFYPNPNLNHTSSDGKNRVFLSLPNANEQWESYDYTYGVPWWALTKRRFSSMVEAAKEVTAPQFSDFADVLDADVVKLLQENGINDVVDLFATSPKAIADKKVTGLTAAAAQKAVTAIMGKMDAETRTKVEWFTLVVGSGSDKYGSMGKISTDAGFFGVEMPYIDMILTYPSAQSVSQYFTYQGSSVAIRTSGYARFADVEIPASVLAGTETLDVVGILGRYEGSPQITMLDAWLSSDTAHANSIIK
ncbi:MAG: hypothetical protein IK052_04010 [Bacteroidales bacterium]|nr:hypothetical protein [Bacteroidales bacterium]